jgi:hypothetical protein
MARVPFEGYVTDGTKLSLLRVEISDIIDVGGFTPHLGGASFRYIRSLGGWRRGASDCAWSISTVKASTRSIAGTQCDCPRE